MQHVFCHVESAGHFLSAAASLSALPDNAIHHATSSCMHAHMRLHCTGPGGPIFLRACSCIGRNLIWSSQQKGGIFLTCRRNFDMMEISRGTLLTAALTRLRHIDTTLPFRPPKLEVSLRK